MDGRGGSRTPTEAQLPLTRRSTGRSRARPGLQGRALSVAGARYACRPCLALRRRTPEDSFCSVCRQPRDGRNDGDAEEGRSKIRHDSSPRQSVRGARRLALRCGRKPCHRCRPRWQPAGTLRAGRTPAPPLHPLNRVSQHLVAARLANPLGSRDV